MTEELKPCPFCGCEAELRSWDWPYVRFQVRCDACKAGPVSRLAVQNDAIVAWNRRAKQAEREALIADNARLREALTGWPIRTDIEGLGDDDGFWRSCSGCHELNEGQPTGPYNPVLSCHVGGGCGECGGIGAVWDTVDYSALGES